MDKSDAHVLPLREAEEEYGLNRHSDDPERLMGHTGDGPRNTSNDAGNAAMRVLREHIDATSQSHVVDQCCEASEEVNNNRLLGEVLRPSGTQWIITIPDTDDLELKTIAALVGVMKRLDEYRDQNSPQDLETQHRIARWFADRYDYCRD